MNLPSVEEERTEHMSKTAREILEDYADKYIWIKSETEHISNTQDALKELAEVVSEQEIAKTMDKFFEVGESKLNVMINAELRDKITKEIIALIASKFTGKEEK